MTISMRNPKYSRNNRLSVQKIIEPQHIGVQVIASYCMVSTSTVRRWLEDGKLRSIKLPSHQYRVSADDFKDFLLRFNIPVKEEFFTEIDPR
jgi:excisionase family DNA binding protein